MSSFHKSHMGQSMCENCGVQPKYPGFEHCGKTCAAEAERKWRVASRRTSTFGAPPPGARSTSTPSNSSFAPKMCLNCRTNPSVSGHHYCSKICAVNSKNQRNSAAPTASAPGPPNSGARQNFSSYGFSTGGQAFNAPAASNFCEHCFKYVKSREMDEDGVVTTHAYCGIACYKASLEQTGFPPSTISAQAADSGSQGALNLRMERLNTPIGRKILQTVQERWISDNIQSPQVKGVYRIDLPGQVYRRFDLALQMNDVFEVTTTYYGGIVTCRIADDTDPSPCASESCELCDALRSSFGNLLYGASCRDESYGPGLYTYLNPASAHDSMMDSDDDPEGQNYALIQCRVVTRADSKPSSNSYSGFIDDSGVVFCAQPTAVIPTHLLTYRFGGASNSRQSTASISSNSPTVRQATSGGARSFGGSGKTESVATGLKSPMGKGKTVANLPLQKPQRQGSARGSPMSSPFIKQGDQDLPTAAMPVSDPATTALRALVKPDSRGSRLSTNMSPSSARFDDDDALAPSSYEPSRAGAQKATRQPHYGLTGSSGNSLDADHDDDRRSNAVAARKHEKRSKDLESRLDEDEDEFDYLNPNENSGRREEKGQSDGEDEDSDDQLPDHPPRYRV